MIRDKITAAFTERLTMKLRESGLASTRSEAGVQFKELAKVAGVSYQMARKYALGMALPEPEVALKIASWLNVSPGWLIFGESTNAKAVEPNQINIKHELLSYILTKSLDQFTLSRGGINISDYILEVIYDASHLDTDIRTTKRIVDMMLSSALTLNRLQLKEG